MQLSADLKKNISKLSHEEKDKLLFRLLKLNPDLCERLQFELVEQGSSLQERREAVEAEINRVVKFEPYSPGYLMMDMRSLNAEITRHVKYTKDKEGEIQLTLLLLKTYLQHHLVFISRNLHRAQTLQQYLVKRLQAVLEKLAKMHPDLYVEYEDDVTYILDLLHTKVAPQLAAKNLPKRWPA